MDFDKYMYLLAIWSVLETLTVVKASENLARGKATNQSSLYHRWDSSKAVDDCVLTTLGSDCCTHTAEGQTEAWWQVDLQTQSVIDTVHVVYRDEGTLRRLAGYEIYLSDTPDWRSGTSCYKDDTPDLALMSATQNVQCPGVARYLTIYNDRRVKVKDWYSNYAYLELCDVIVNGCPIGKYGNRNCNNDCFNCLNDICDPSSGICDCNDGYYGPACTTCSSGCSTNACDKTSGHCLSNCNDGYYGPFCTSCPIGCSGNTCDKATGHCLSECVAGFYGNNCDQQCPANCTNNLCLQGSGVCTQCVQGFYGSTCDQACSVTCKDKLCNQGNGFCTQCISGYHGNLCERNCPSNCKDSSCNKASGVCTGCESGYHGSNCSLMCSDNCKERTCIQDNGQCTECTPGFHGSNCMNTCGYCHDGQCDRETGICVTSCIEGLTGHRCGVKDVSLPIKEDDLTVAVIGVGSGCGVVVVVMAIVIFVLTRRLRLVNNQDTTKSTIMTDISLRNIGQDQKAEKDGAYDIIEPETREENGMNESTRNSGYEQLGDLA